jgi:hypothetical protein
MIQDAFEEPAAHWWAARRRRYNVALVLAGVSAFIAYATVASVFSQHFNQLEITGFTVTFQAVGYAVAMALANLLYFLGPLSERILKPSNPKSYRIVTYRLGLWFSVLLPFLLPVALIYDVVTGA